MNLGDVLECLDDQIVIDNNGLTRQSKYLVKGQYYTFKAIDPSTGEIILEECPKGRFKADRFIIIPESLLNKTPMTVQNSQHIGHDIVRNYVMTMKGKEEFNYCRQCKVEVI